MKNFLLLEEKILEAYGLCTNESEMDKWLESQEDKGNLYYSLKNRIDGVNVRIYEQQIKEYEQWFCKFFNSFLDTKVLEEILVYFEDYTRPKTSIEKIKYSEIYDKIFKLSNHSFIPVNEYISARYNIQIKDHISNVNNDILVDYNKNIITLKEIVNKLSSEYKFINNKTRYLSDKLYNFDIVKYQKYIKINRQVSTEYAKLWSKLNKKEKENRIVEYIHKKVSTDEDVIKDILDSYQNKGIQYNNIKWNAKYGEIDNITNIIDNKVQVKSKTVPKSIFEENSNERMINELILYTLITSDKTYEQVINDICVKLNKKLIFHDKKVIKTKYNVIKETIFECFE